MNWRGRDFYFQNKAAMLFYSTHLMDDLAIAEIAADSLTGDNFSELDHMPFTADLLKNTGTVTTVSGEVDASFGSVSGIGIFNNSYDRGKEEAIKKLVYFLYRQDVYNTWLHMSPGGMLPVMRHVIEDDNFYRDPIGVFRKFGKSRIIDMITSLEDLVIINPEDLMLTDSNNYREKDFQNFLYMVLNRNEGSPIDFPEWIH